MESHDRNPRETCVPLREAPGRETRYVRRGAERWIEKRFDGADRREAWRERLRGAAPRSPARREFDALEALREAGVSVPRPLDLAEDGARSRLRLEFVPHAETLRERLGRAAPAERRAWSDRLLRLVLRLHGAGWYHRDLYLEHVLLRAGDEELVLIDLGRARRDRRTRRRWFEKDLAALAHSAPDTVGDAERLRFLAGYLDGRGVERRRERRGFARAVLRRARRMADHLPRHGTSHPLPREARA